VLETACREAQGWHRDHPSRLLLYVSVNLSARQLRDAVLASDIQDVLAATGLPAKSLTLEITETAVMDDIDRTIDKLRELKGLGVRLAIDDFGTGYSSLTYLRRLPIDVIKIDRSFVAGVAAASDEWALAQAIVRLIRTLKLETVAEGVETGAQVAHLRALGCDRLQGYYFAKPNRPTRFASASPRRAARRPQAADNPAAVIQDRSPVRLVTCTPWSWALLLLASTASERRGDMRVDTAGVAGPTPAASDYAYRALAEHLPDVAIFVFDQDLRFAVATGAGMRESAWSAEEVVGRTVFELFPPERAALLAARYRAALTGERVSFEVVGSRGQPDHVWAVDVVPIRDQDGAVTGGMAVARDVTEQRRAEEQLRTSHQQLVQAQRIARVGSFEWELATGRLTMSEEVYRILGLDPATPLSLEEVVALVHRDDLPAMRALLDRLACDPTPYQIEFRIRRADGSWRTVLARGEGVCDDSGRVVRVIATDQDITEAKQAEEERRRLLARLYEVLEGQHQRLAADLHDSHVQSQAAIGLKLDQARLRLGPTTVAATRVLLDELRDDVAAEGAALRRTIGALRPLVLDQRGLAAAVGELAAATRARAALAACTLTDALDGERLDPEVETVLFRVAQQALANVEQHAAARHVHLRLERSGPWVVLAVDDDGCGFEPSHVEVLPGHQGFGLTSMGERVQAIGGRLTVVTQPGGGTRVEARVPAEPDP